MNLADVFDEIWEVLGAVPDLHVADDGPGIHGAPPSPYLELPEVVYGEAGAGLDRIPDLGLTVVFGPTNNAKTFRSALEHASNDGPRSIPAALLAHEWVSCHTLRPGRAEPAAVDIRGTAALAYIFHLDITGAS